MKIIVLSTYEQSGGAAIAANRLMVALRKTGVDTKMFVRDKQTDDPNVISVNLSFFARKLNQIRFLWERFVLFIYNKLTRQNIFAVSIANVGTDISKHPEIQDADIIHLHWINQGFLSINDIHRLIRTGKPIVWTMHDQWAYTGICHYTSGCDKFQSHCFYCMKLKVESERDLSYRIFEKKRELYINSRITFVGCSRWISQEAIKSSLCKDNQICSIPNPIDTNLYVSGNKNLYRRELNIPGSQRKLILFGACKVTDERKGVAYFKLACDVLKHNYNLSSEDILIVVFGGHTDELATLLPFDIYDVGYINDVQMMVKLYNAVDLFVVPSLEDNLPNTIMEAMACGTPCVGFDTGGIPEMIDHKENGYVAEYKNTDDLAKGIFEVLFEADYMEMSKKARLKVEENYAEKIVVDQYVSVYKEVLTTR